jgi:type II secretory ATPase GspE/PulE/Tfp pilus assembly ATPase PilB-like protein
VNTARGRAGQRIAAVYAGGESSAAAVIGEVESGVDLSRMMQDLPAVEDLLEAADDAPIIRMLNALLTQAAKDGASDIHIEPYERSSAVRFRVDGTLREVVQPNKRPARGADLAPEDHGRARHRREAPAAGRPHQPAHRRARDRRAREHPARLAW